MKEIDLNLIKKSFSKDFIKELKNCYDDYFSTSKSIDNQHYFGTLGTYTNRNDKHIDKEISDYFERLLFLPNITILDYILKNLDKFSKLNFIDNGAGLGLLSVFLKELGITCFNYDNYSQISNVTFHEIVKNKLNVDIMPVTDRVDLLGNFKGDVITSSGIWLSSPAFDKMDVKCLLMDSFYFGRGTENSLINKCELTLSSEYEGAIKIYSKI